MAIKTFTAGSVLTASDTNTYLANSGLVYVTSATVSGSTTGIQINNCFSSTFDDYLIRSRFSWTGSDIFIQFSVGGTPTGGTAYNSSIMQAYTGAGVTVSRQIGVASIPLLSNCNGVQGSAVTEIFSPNVARQTLVQNNVLRNDGAYSNTASYQIYGNCNNTTQFDGLTLTSGGNAITGTITVFGYRKP